MNTGTQATVVIIGAELYIALTSILCVLLLTYIGKRNVLKWTYLWAHMLTLGQLGLFYAVSAVWQTTHQQAYPEVFIFWETASVALVVGSALGALISIAEAYVLTRNGTV